MTFDLGLMGWTPTLELTAHVRAIPAPGWLRVVHSTRNHANGFLEEDAEVWDSTGRLVAQSRHPDASPQLTCTTTGALMRVRVVIACPRQVCV